MAWKDVPVHRGLVTVQKEGDLRSPWLVLSGWWLVFGRSQFQREGAEAGAVQAEDGVGDGWGEAHDGSFAGAGGG